MPSLLKTTLYLAEKHLPSFTMRYKLCMFNPNRCTIKILFVLDTKCLNSYRFGSRSIRRSVRSGSIKLKQTYEHLMENGDIGVNRVTSSRARPHDLDIKLLQAKRQQAEMRRSIFSFVVVSSLNCIPFGVVEIKGRKICGKIIHFSTHLYLQCPGKVNLGRSAR